MDLRDIKSMIKHLDIKPRKKLSQVFLFHRGYLTRIARCASSYLATEGPVLEIGAGPGTLTLFLVRSGLRVIAIEIDERFAPILTALCREFAMLDVVIADARYALFSPNAPRNVVGNLPYHISSELLLAMVRSGVKKALITLQREVAERIIAKPGTSAYGRLSVIMQLSFNIKKLFDIPPRAFRPSPEVYSSTVFMERIREYDELMSVVENVTRCIFSYRNKVVDKVLRKCFPRAYGELSEALREWLRARVFELEPRVVMEIARICVERKEC